MTPSAISLGVIFAIVAIGVTIGFLAGVRRKMSLEQWTVGARGFGTILIFLLMAGEIYTTVSFLGSSGWAYSQGGPSLYLLAYLTLGSIVGFFILPPVWELGRRHKLQTQSDFFAFRYGNKYLAAFVCVVGVTFLIPYVQIQIKGLGIIVNVASFGGIGQKPAMIVSVALLAAFVLVSGVRAAAWISVLKDILMVAAAVTIGIGIPYIHYGGAGPMIAALRQAHPAHLTMPGASPNHGHAWYVTTVMLTSLGLYIWPHGFAALYTAKSADALRRNAMMMPFYTLTLAFILVTGFTAVTIVPGLADGDLSLLTVVRKSFPPWFLGVVGGAGALTAMVPASILILTASTLFVKNLWRPIFAPDLTEDQITRRARAMVVVVAGIALFLALNSSLSLAGLLLLGYAGITQFFPGVVLGIYWPRVTTAGVFTGMAVGVAWVGWLVIAGRDTVFGYNAGFLALCLNFAITVGVSLLTQPRVREETSVPLEV